MRVYVEHRTFGLMLGISYSPQVRDVAMIICPSDVSLHFIKWSVVLMWGEYRSEGPDLETLKYAERM